jgi:hypothetical protein
MSMHLLSLQLTRSALWLQMGADLHKWSAQLTLVKMAEMNCVVKCLSNFDTVVMGGSIRWS